MKLRALLPALFLSLYACASTPPPAAPGEIPPPPASLMEVCPAPDDLPESVTAQQLVDWTQGWVLAYACEAAKHLSLLLSWPR